MRFTELDELLNQNDDPYFFSDSFMLVGDLLARFDRADWEQVLLVWDNRSESWKEKLSSNLNGLDFQTLKMLLTKALDNQENEIVLAMMNNLPAQTDDDLLYDRLLDFTVQYWHQHPEARERLKQTSWQAGLSKRLLTRLGFNQWHDSKELNCL